jgi:hypothetical protein
MTRAPFRPCPECSRHVRVTDAACPFCAVAFDAAFRTSPHPVPPSVRLSRAALVAFGTGTLSLAACGGALAGNVGGPGDAGKDTGATSAVDSGVEQQGDDSGFTTALPYGAFPPPEDAGVDSGPSEPPPIDAAIDSPLPAPPYGGVPEPGH